MASAPENLNRNRIDSNRFMVTWSQSRCEGILESSLKVYEFMSFVLNIQLFRVNMKGDYAWLNRRLHSQIIFDIAWDVQFDGQCQNDNFIWSLDSMIRQRNSSLPASINQKLLNCATAAAPCWNCNFQFKLVYDERNYFVSVELIEPQVNGFNKSICYSIQNASATRNR